MDFALGLALRWMHLIAAALVIGGAFFMRVLLPAGLSHLDESAREGVYLKCRRAFKMTVHPAILFLLVSGTINSIRLFPDYKGLHALWGIHILLGVIAMGISLWLLMGERPPASHRSWIAVNLAILAILVGVASALKAKREMNLARPPAALPSMPAGSYR